MASRIECEPGGIQGLLALHDEHTEAVERDLIALGLRWRDVGSKRFTWADLRSIVHASQPGSAMYRAMTPESAGWSHSDYLMADLYDAVAWNTFVTARVTGSKSKKPKPYPRPGVKHETHAESTKTGTTLMTREEAWEWFGWDAKEAPHGR